MEVYPGEFELSSALHTSIQYAVMRQAIPIDNRLMTQRSMEEPISLIRDAMEEMKQAAEEEKEDCVVEEEEQKTKEDQKKKSASVAGSSFLFRFVSTMVYLFYCHLLDILLV